MSYKHLVQQDVDLSRLGFGDSLLFEFNEEECLLRISVFDGFHYQDHLVVDLAYELGEKTTDDGTPIPQKSPCDLCKFNPPSSTDGKPCTICPASASK